jgi:hypothetical protein
MVVSSYDGRGPIANSKIGNQSIRFRFVRPRVQQQVVPSQNSLAALPNPREHSDNQLLSSRAARMIPAEDGPQPAFPRSPLRTNDN